MPRRRSPWFWVIVPLLFTTAAAVAVVLVRQTHRQVLVESDPIDMPDDELGYRLRPDLDGARLVIPGRPVPPSFHASFDARVAERRGGIRLREFTVSTSSMGYRGPPVAADKPAGTVRVVCLGDSITFGWGVAEDEGYVRIAERALRDAAGPAGPRVELLNAGVPGYTLDQIAGSLERDILPLRPDLVTVCKLGDLRAADPLADYRAELAHIAALARGAGARLALLCPPRSTFDRWPLTPRFRDAMEAEAAAQGALFVDFMTLVDDASAGRGVEVIVDGDTQRLVDLDAGGRAVVEVRYTPGDGDDPLARELYTALDGTALAEALMFDDGHPDAEGHRLLGEHLAERLLEDGLLAREGEGGAAAADQGAESSSPIGSGSTSSTVGVE